MANKMKIQMTVDKVKIGNIYVVGLSSEQEAFLIARGEFAKEYCRKKGWPVEPEKLSIEQIMEIRQQDGWKQPKT